MKFIAPEVEIKKFNVNDILTASMGGNEGGEGGDPIVSEEDTTISVFESDNEGACTGNDSDWGVPNCL